METSTYGSEMVAMIIVTKSIMAMRYSFIILRYLIDDPVYIMKEKNIVVTDCSIPYIILKKKKHSITNN